MIKVREMQAADVDALVDMAQAMHAESPRYRDATFCEAKTRHLMEYLATGPEGGGFVALADGAITGMIGGMATEYLFSTDKFVCDAGLYVVPERRGSSAAVRLIKAFESWAWAQGVREITLGISTGVQAGRTVCVYQKMGFRMASYGLVKRKGD